MPYIRSSAILLHPLPPFGIPPWGHLTDYSVWIDSRLPNPFRFLGASGGGYSQSYILFNKSYPFLSMHAFILLIM